MRSAARILVFARVPQAGCVKTRLIPALGAAGACAVHATLVERTLELAMQVGAPVELWLDGAPDHPSVAAWRSRYPLCVRWQRGAGLGARMGEALRQTLRTSRSALLLGCDCVTLTERDLRFALSKLRSLDAVIAPARDGGYVMLGVSRPADTLLHRIPWGTSHVLAVTRRRMHSRGWSYRLLHWQHDVDRPADLHRVLRELGPAKLATGEFESRARPS